MAASAAETVVFPTPPGPQTTTISFADSSCSRCGASCPGQEGTRRARVPDGSRDRDEGCAPVGSSQQLLGQGVGNLADCTKPVHTCEEVRKVQQGHVGGDLGAKSLEMGDAVAPDGDREPRRREHVLDGPREVPSSRATTSSAGERASSLKTSSSERPNSSGRTRFATTQAR